MDGQSDSSLPGGVVVPVDSPKVILTPAQQKQLEKDQGLARLSIAGMKDAAAVGEELERMGAIKVGAGHVMIATAKVAPLLEAMLEISLNEDLDPEARVAAGDLAHKLYDTRVKSLKILNEITESKNLGNGKGDNRRPGPPPPSVNIHTQNLTISQPNG